MSVEDDEIFERSMTSLGVEPLDGGGVARGESPAEELDENERRLFEEALRDLGAPVGKDVVSGGDGGRFRVQRVKARAKGERVDEHLDLHGLKSEEALRRLESFVAEAAGAGARTVRVITGKGHHSPGGRGVLKQRVEEWIVHRGRRRVRAFADAPRRLGGRGAYLLYLRPSE